jgi:hypothetical protein
VFQANFEEYDGRRQHHASRHGKYRLAGNGIQCIGAATQDDYENGPNNDEVQHNDTPFQGGSGLGSNNPI